MGSCMVANFHAPKLVTKATRTREKKGCVQYKEISIESFNDMGGNSFMWAFMWALVRDIHVD